MIKLFEFNDGKISLARAEIGLYKEFAAILRRDRGSDSDSDGRKKFMAMKEFHYIYLTCDGDSNLRDKGFAGQELKEKAREEAELPDNWKEDAFIKAAMRKYEQLNFDIKKELIYELLILFRGNLDRVKQLRRAIDEALLIPELTRSEIDKIVVLQGKVFDIAAATPSKIKSLQRALKDSDELDMEDIPLMRGGKPIPESANPNTAKS